MTDPTPTSALPSETTTPPETETVVLTIPTTDSLSQERLEEIAESCLLPFEPTPGGGGIDVTLEPDPANIAFWAARGNVWGHLYDEPTS